MDESYKLHDISLELSQKELLSRIEEHPVFKQARNNVKERTSSKKRTISFKRNVLVLDKYSQVFFCDSNNDIYSFSLTKLQRVVPEEEPDLNFKILKCNPEPLGFEVKDMIFNRKSSLLCIIGRHNCTVITMSIRVQRELAKTDSENDTVNVRAAQIGRFFHNRDPSVTIRCVHWHPLSDCHLAVLTSDNTLRLYDLATNIEEAEQTFRLYDLLPFSSSSSRSAFSSPFSAPLFDMVDFCFASPLPISPTSTVATGEGASWNNFTAFFLSDDGPIYALSPILPYNCVIEASLLTDLQDIVQDKLIRLRGTQEEDDDDEERESHLFSRYRDQLKWLFEVQGQVVVKKNYSTESEVSTEAPAWIMSRQPTTIRSAPVLQGPINPLDKGDPMYKQIVEEEIPHRLSVVPPFPVSQSSRCGVPGTLRVLFRTFHSGLLETFIAFEDYEPEWDKRNYFHSDDTKWLLLYEREDLELPISVHKSGFGPDITFDPEYLDRIYIRHSAGVHKITMPWLKELYSFVLEEDAAVSHRREEEKYQEKNESNGDDVDDNNDEFSYKEDPDGFALSLPDLPPSFVEHLLNTVPVDRSKSDTNKFEGEEAPIIGFLVVHSLSMGHLFISISDKWTCRCRNVKVDEFLDAPTLLSKVQPVPIDLIKDESEYFANQIHELLQQKQTVIPRFGTDIKEGMPLSLQTLELLIRTCATLKSEYITYIKHIHLETMHRLDILEKMKEEQKETIEILKENIAHQVERSTALAERLLRMAKFQDMLNKRIQTIQDLINLHQPRLSIEEKKYHKDLADKEIALSWFKNKIEKLKLQSEEVLEKQQSSKYSLSEPQVQRIFKVLQREDQMISKTQAGYVGLQRAIEKLEIDFGI